MASVFLRIAVLASSVAIVTSCSSNTASTQASSPAAASGAIKIGIDLPVSGADASTGIPTRNGAVLAIEEAKPLPGGATFAAYDLDDAVQGAHDPGQGAQNVRQFVSDTSVLAMVGPFNSSVAAAEIPITNDAGLAQISPATTNPTLTKGEAAKRFRTSHPDVNAFFRVCTTDDKQGAAGAAFARGLKLSKAFIIDDNETYGKGLADIFEQSFRAGGGAILGHEHLTKGQTDYKALLTKAHALHPDVVFYGGTTSTGGGLVRKQMADAGLGAVTYVGGDGIADAEFLRTAGDAANGTYYTVAAPEASKLPSASAFIAAYEKRWKTPVGPYSANAYVATKIEIAAIRKAFVAGAAPARSAVLANVAATKNFASPIGPVGFDAAGDTTNGILSVYEVKGGKATFVRQISMKS